ncbi:MAG: hypothetical protein V4850_32255 [Myxococcota bacterium]
MDPVPRVVPDAILSHPDADGRREELFFDRGSGRLVVHRPDEATADEVPATEMARTGFFAENVSGENRAVLHRLERITDESDDELVFDPSTGKLIVQRRGAPPPSPDSVSAVTMARTGFFSGSSAVGPFAEGLRDGANGVDRSGATAVRHGMRAVGVLGAGTAGAALAGAGSLTGYAGLATGVSTLGLGGATTTIASVAGLTAATGAPLAGAAATSAVVAAVGGPLIAAAAVVGGVAAVGYGIYKAGSWIGEALFG